MIFCATGHCGKRYMRAFFRKQLTRVAVLAFIKLDVRNGLPFLNFDKFTTFSKNP